MATPNVATLLVLLKSKKLDDVVKELEEGLTSFEEMMSLSEAQLERRCGNQGMHIFNHLHPEASRITMITSTRQILDMTYAPITSALIRSSAATTTSVAKKYPMPPLKLAEWSNFGRDVINCTNSIPDVPLAAPFVPYEPIKCTGEQGVQSIADNSVYRYLNILMDTLHPHFNFLTRGEFTGIDGRKKVVADPDRIWSPVGYTLSKLIVEFKTPWALKGGDNLVELYNAECSKLNSGRIKKKGKVMRSIEQTYIYMTINRHRYGCFTTFDRTWFLRKVEDSSSEHSSKLEISPVIHCDSNSPVTLNMAWVYLLFTIERSADWLYSSPHSSAVTSPSEMITNMVADYDRYKSIRLDGLMHWKDIIGRTPTGAVAIGTFCDLPDVVFKTIDIYKKSGGLKQFDHEVEMYKHLESLQGLCIPKFIAYGNLGGLIQVIVLENVGNHITLDQFYARKHDIDIAVQKIHSLNVEHGDLRLPNIAIDSNDCIRILDFGMSSIKEPNNITDHYEVEND